jgi:iron complex transport system substrate-binding protein
VARKPDLVLLTPARQAVHTLLPTLEKLNIPAVVITSRNVEAIKDNLRKIAGLLGDPPAGESVISRMERRLAEIGERGRTMIKPRVLLITGLLPNGLFLTAREGSYTADIVTLAGGIQALEETGYPGLPTRVPQMSPETLLLADPDIIIHTRRQGESPAMSEYLRRPFFSDLKAIRGGHVYEVPSAEFLIPGPRVVDGAERLASIFERWAQR